MIYLLHSPDPVPSLTTHQVCILVYTITALMPFSEEHMIYKNPGHIRLLVKFTDENHLTDQNDNCPGHLTHFQPWFQLR